MRATDRNDTPDTTRERDTRLENFAAELTSAAYRLMLRRGLKGSWIWTELSLWRALAETVQKWARESPPVAPSGESDAWRAGLLADLTARASSIALNNGIEGPLLELDLGLYRAFRLVLKGRSRRRTPDDRP
jgi:hypothetical protein